MTAINSCLYPFMKSESLLTQSAVVVEYTDCIFADE